MLLFRAGGPFRAAKGAGVIDPLSHALLDGLQEAVWLIDESSLTILHANQAAQRLSGLALDAVGGESVVRLAATPQDQAFWAEPAQVVADGIHSNTRLLRSDGMLVSVDRCVTRLRCTPWPETVFMLTMWDQSRQESTERELETLLSQLRATLDSTADGLLVL